MAMDRPAIEAYVEGAENALNSGKWLARGALKLGIACHAVMAHADDPGDWVDNIRLRISALLSKYEEKLG